MSRPIDTIERLLKEAEENRKTIADLRAAVRAIADDALDHAVPGHSSVQTSLIDAAVRLTEEP